MEALALAVAVTAWTDRAMPIALPPVTAVSCAMTARMLFEALARAPDEIAGIAYLDGSGRLLGVRHAVGGRDWCRIAPRRVVGDALAFDAHAAVIAHNHPSGSAQPSESDRVFTRVLAQALAVVEVRLHDALILTPHTTTSFRALGLM
jgi:DNA repair protein RadC